MPTRFAVREPKMTYLAQIQQEINTFLKEKVKHDFLQPDRELTLSLSVKEAEILICANPDVRAMADSGDLRKLHDKCKAVEG